MNSNKEVAKYIPPHRRDNKAPVSAPVSTQVSKTVSAPVSTQVSEPEVVPVGYYYQSKVDILFWWIKEGNLKMVQETVEKGVDLSIFSTKGETVLTTTLGVNREIFEFLIQKGADIHQKNIKGKTCLDVLDLKLGRSKDVAMWNELIENAYNSHFQLAHFSGSIVSIPKPSHYIQSTNKVDSFYSSSLIQSRILCLISMLFHKFIILDENILYELALELLSIFEDDDIQKGSKDRELHYWLNR